MSVLGISSEIVSYNNISKLLKNIQNWEVLLVCQILKAIVKTSIYEWETLWFIALKLNAYFISFIIYF